MHSLLSLLLLLLLLLLLVCSKHVSSDIENCWLETNVWYHVTLQTKLRVVHTLYLDLFLATFSPLNMVARLSRCPGRWLEIVIRVLHWSVFKLRVVHTRKIVVSVLTAFSPLDTVARLSRCPGRWLRWSFDCCTCWPPSSHTASCSAPGSTSAPPTPSSGKPPTREPPAPRLCLNPSL